jgi:hypothetical protein
MPWEAILGAAGGSAVVTVFGVLIAQKLLDTLFAGNSRHLESTIQRAEAVQQSYLKRAEETHRSTLNKAEETFRRALEWRGSMDTDLRQRRVHAYEPIWERTGLFPRWPRATGITREQLLGLSEWCRGWYFREGGMWLSENARTAYGEMQGAFNRVLQLSGEGILSEQEYDQLMAACSAFRSQLTEDLLSRRPSPSEEAVR